MKLLNEQTSFKKAAQTVCVVGAELACKVKAEAF